MCDNRTYHTSKFLVASLAKVLVPLYLCIKKYTFNKWQLIEYYK